MEAEEPMRKGQGDLSDYHNDFDARRYNLSGRIMLTAVIILFFVIVLMLCLHLYSRWYLHRARRRHLRRNRILRRAQLVFYVDPDNPTDPSAVAASRGLDASVIASLAVFAYSPETHPEPVDCAVCLSEFEEGETGRVLPKCGHSFHTDCIDMWFHSHSTCPLCRAPVEPAPAGENRPEVVITVCEPGSSSGFCEECRNGEEEANRTGQAVSSSSIGLRRKPSSLVDITIEVPARNGSFGDESGRDSASTQSSFRSPMGRMLSFKRILSRDRRGSASPSSVGAVGYSSVTEIEPERGGRDEAQ